jgi:cell wall-associated NlpC family hydrolase
MIRSVARAVIAATLLTGVVVIPADQADAATTAQRSAIVREAKKHVGKPYRYGAAGPDRFDCSGFTLYVTRKATGRKLPHNADRQMRSSLLKSITKGRARPGDLLFFTSGGRAYHAAIYAGGGKMWDAGTSRVRYRSIWTYSGVRWRTLR